ncbi:MAG: alpha/beta fold hydrolase [Alphaproteobacteria bacterium]|jgi:class 3 adenylate cyclase/pimeloyl-ACP methyl ester carboxylesterase|nr:alpha/beta fold hydrolase [Alphaproteobacteria bacterium]
MSDDAVIRKLTAILYADVAGYSRLTGADEVGTHKQLSAGLDLISGRIEGAGGRVVHYAGDAVLAEFASVVAAVECAVGIQRQLADDGANIPADKRLEFRIGVNLGEVIVDRDDIYGDGVNVAARLESLAEPGGICVSGAVVDQVRGKLDVGFEDMGAQQVKNIADPVRAYKVTREGGAPKAASGVAGARDMEQDIRFCTAPDGVRLAYATVGTGPPLIKSANWLNHLEYDWESPIWRHVLHALAEDRCLIRYDQRGNGLSDWDAEDLSFDAWVSDFETMVEATGADRFPILGISQGSGVAIAYTVQYPERVSRLILYGSYARGRNHRGSQTNIDEEQALMTVIRNGWGQENPAFRQVFTSLFVPNATAEQMQWFNDVQRITTTAENAVRQRQIQNDINVTDLLDQVSVPTLVMHVREDGVVPFDEGRRVAAAIPGARFVPLDGQNHLILEHEPAWPRFLEEVRAFLAEGD